MSTQPYDYQGTTRAVGRALASNHTRAVGRAIVALSLIHI